MRLRIRISVVAAALWLALDPTARAQGQPRAIEIETRARILRARQEPRFTSFSDLSRWIFIDSTRSVNGGRELLLSFGAGQRATILTDSTGHVTSLTTIPRPGQGSRPSGRLDLFESYDGPLALPATRVWDLVPTFRPARKWTDTIALVAAVEGNRQALSGTRVSRVIGDTIVAGRRLYIVWDSAAVHYDEIALVETSTLETPATEIQAAAGVIRGRMLFDPEWRLFRERDDTMLLAGTGELRYPDGRAFTTPLRQERTRHWITYDSSGYAARQIAMAADRERTMGGMVRVPTNDTDRRLRDGDHALRDSLLSAWRATHAPNGYIGLYNRLSYWTRDTALVRRLDSLRTADGDSAFIIDQLSRRAYDPRSWPMDTATMSQLIAVMANPGLAFAFGVSRDRAYEDLGQALRTWPPAGVRDTSGWPCSPRACRMLAEQWPIAAEPRLRQLGLIAHFVLDPRGWTDTLLAHAAPSAPLLVAALPLARGGDTVTMSGRVNAVAIRFAEARTGRDIAGELRRKLAASSSDADHARYEYILMELGEITLTVDSIVARLASRLPARCQLGLTQVERLFHDSPPRADPVTAEALQDQLIAMSLAGGRPWRFHECLPETARMARPPREAAVEKDLLLADSLTPALRAKWGARLRLITGDDWTRRSEREGGTLFVLSGVDRIGPFVRLRIDSRGRLPRRPDQTPWLYAAGTTYYLMQVNGDWVIVGVRSWIT